MWCLCRRKSTVCCGGLLLLRRLTVGGHVSALRDVSRLMGPSVIYRRSVEFRVEHGLAMVSIGELRAHRPADRAPGVRFTAKMPFIWAEAPRVIGCDVFATRRAFGIIRCGRLGARAAARPHRVPGDVFRRRAAAARNSTGVMRMSAQGSGVVLHLQAAPQYVRPGRCGDRCQRRDRDMDPAILGCDPDLFR